MWRFVWYDSYNHNIPNRFDSKALANAEFSEEVPRYNGILDCIRKI